MHSVQVVQAVHLSGPQTSKGVPCLFRAAHPVRYPLSRPFSCGASGAVPFRPSIFVWCIGCGTVAAAILGRPPCPWEAISAALLRAELMDEKLVDAYFPSVAESTVPEDEPAVTA
jgi:hypothetical protein